MTIADLRHLIADLPDDVVVAVRGYESGFDPLIIAAVRSLAPVRSPRPWNGVLIDEDVDWASRRFYFALGSADRATCLVERFAAANIEAVFDADDDRWCALGWREVASIPDQAILHDD